MSSKEYLKGVKTAHAFGKGKEDRKQK